MLALLLDTERYGFELVRALADADGLVTSEGTLYPLAADYLDRLRRAGRGLPRGRLKELVTEIEGHLAEAVRPEASDAGALTVLDRLGEPEEIVDAERPHGHLSRPTSPVIGHQRPAADEGRIDRCLP